MSKLIDAMLALAMMVSLTFSAGCNVHEPNQPALDFAQTPPTRVIGNYARVFASSVMSFCQAGPRDYIKGSLDTIYYLDRCGTRFTLPYNEVYYSWEDTMRYTQMDDADVAQIPLGGNVRFKPRVVLVKIASNTDVYWVEYGRNHMDTRVRHIVDEATAIAMIGLDWDDFTQTVPDPFFVDYVVDAPITDPSDVVVDRSKMKKKWCLVENPPPGC